MWRLDIPEGFSPPPGGALCEGWDARSRADAVLVVGGKEGAAPLRPWWL